MLLQMYTNYPIQMEILSQVAWNKVNNNDIHIFETGKQSNKVP